MPDDWVARGIEHPVKEPVDLAVTLDQQLYPALVPLIEDFARQRKVKIAVSDGTCGLSAGALSDKTADMGGFCCPPGYTDRLPGLEFHTLGIGALALIVHPDNAVADLTIDEARRIFGGDVQSWAELPMGGIKGGDDQRVRAVARLHCKLRPGHWRLILEDENRFRYDLAEVAAIVDMVSEVARNEEAIGYETLWHIQRLTEAGGVKLLKIGGVDPTDRDAVAAGRYPLYRVFNITTWGPGAADNPLADELAAYLIERAPELDDAYGIVPAQKLRKNGWKFRGDELVGEPG